MSATTEDLITFLRGLRQVREYTSEPVSEEVINDILEVGRWSGSSANKQPTEVIVVRDRAVLEKLGGWGTKPAATSAVSFVIASKNDRPGMDEGRLGERLMLAARAHGLGAAFATLKENGPEETRRALGLPPELHAHIVVSIGHNDREARKALPPRPGGPRKPMSEFAHWERYGQAG